MLMCWNEEPQRRPQFTELRAKFDAMLLAERKDAYIDLRIDNDKPYYRLDTMATITTNGLNLSPNPSRHSFILSPSRSMAAGNKVSSKECSPKPVLHTPSFSPAHKSQASCCSSTHASPRKPEISNLSPSLNSFTSSSPHHDSCEQNRTISEDEMRGRDGNAHGGAGRPVSLLLPRDRDRERRERQNPYVDEPSRVAATALMLPGGGIGGHARRGSDGAIELNQLRSRENGESGIQITITGD